MRNCAHKDDAPLELSLPRLHEQLANVIELNLTLDGWALRPFPPPSKCTCFAALWRILFFFNSH